jgi:hypothetical protein
MSNDRYKSLCQRIQAMENWQAAALCAVCASKVRPIIARLGLPGTFRLVEKSLDHVWQNIGQSGNRGEELKLAVALELTPEWQVDDTSYLPSAVTQVLDFVQLALLAAATPESAKENACGAFDLLVGVASCYDFSAKEFLDAERKRGSDVSLQKSEEASQERLTRLLEKETRPSDQTITALRQEADGIAALFKALLPMHCYGYVKD